MSHPPEPPGRRQTKRTAASAAGDAYQGAFEAVIAVLLGAGVGYWVDGRWDTTPVGVLVGVVIGFAAMVLRLMRLGRELAPEATNGSASARVSPPGQGTAAGSDDERGPAEMPGLSDVWRDEGPDERE